MNNELTLVWMFLIVVVLIFMVEILQFMEIIKLSHIFQGKK